MHQLCEIPIQRKMRRAWKPSRGGQPEYRREDGVVIQLLNDLEWPPLELRRKCHRIVLSRIVTWQKHYFHPRSTEGAFKLQHKITGNLHQPTDLQEQLLPKNNDRIQQPSNIRPVHTWDPSQTVPTGTF